jgi:PAS domain-containing protein
MFWLYLLGAVTVLTIAVRRLMLRQKPLADDLYAKQVAVDHVFDGVAWVTEGGRIAYLNPALARALEAAPERFKGRTWFEMFAPDDRLRVRDAYSQMLLSGKALMTVQLLDARGALKPRGLLIVAVHDHKARLTGHHCILHEGIAEGHPEEQFALAGQN